MSAIEGHRPGQGRDADLEPASDTGMQVPSSGGDNCHHWSWAPEPGLARGQPQTLPVPCLISRASPVHQAWAATEAVALKTDVVPVPVGLSLVGSLVVTTEKSKENMLDSEGGKVTSMTEGPLEGSERRNQH